ATRTARRAPSSPGGRGPDVEDLVRVGRLALRLGTREVADEDDALIGVALDHRERTGEGRRADVVRQREDRLLLEKVDGVLDAWVRLVVVVERYHRDGAPMDAAPRVHLVVVRL